MNLKYETLITKDEKEINKINEELYEIFKSIF